LPGDSLKTREDESSENLARIRRANLLCLAHMEALENDEEGRFQVRIKEKSDFLPVIRRIVAELRRRMRHN